MTGPITGQYSGFDAAIKKGDKFFLDGKADDIRFEIGETGQTGRIYIKNPDGSENLLTNTVKTYNHKLTHTEMHCMQITVDADITISGHHIERDGKGDVILIVWENDESGSPKIVQENLYLFSDTKCFDQAAQIDPNVKEAISSQDTIERLDRQKYSRILFPENNETTIILDVIKDGKFTQPDSEHPNGMSFDGTPSPIKARIGFHIDEIQ